MNKNKKHIGIGIGSTLLILLINYVGFQFVVSESVDLQKVYVTSRDIAPREEIKEDDVVEVEIPKAYLQENVYLSKKDIVGKYTEVQGFIPKGSLFYKSMLYSEDSLPDYPSMLLKENQVSYGIQTDVVKTSGNTLVVGQKVDVYVSVDLPERKTVADCLIRAVRITGLKDRNGLDLSDEESSKIPFVVTIAVDKKQVEFLEIAEEMGSVNIYGVSVDYTNQEESVLNEQSKVLKYLKWRELLILIN